MSMGQSVCTHKTRGFQSGQKGAGRRSEKEKARHAYWPLKSSECDLSGATLGCGDATLLTLTFTTWPRYRFGYFSVSTSAAAMGPVELSDAERTYVNAVPSFWPLAYLVKHIQRPRVNHRHCCSSSPYSSNVGQRT